MLEIYIYIKFKMVVPKSLGWKIIDSERNRIKYALF